MQNFPLSVDLVFPNCIIRVFPVRCWLLMCDRMISYLVPFGIRTFHQEIISIVMGYKQGPYCGTTVWIGHFVKKLVVQLQVLLFNIIVEGHHDNLRSLFRRQTARWIAIVTAPTIWWKTLFRIARLSGLKLRTNFTQEQE